MPVYVGVRNLKKRIYLNFLGVILLCATLLSVSVSGVVYNAIRNREIAAIKDRAVLVADLLNKGLGEQYADNKFSDYANYDADIARITVIAPDGTVLLDNKAGAASLENHGDRDEFREALKTGRGEATRYSTTLGADTYYYAILLDDGNVLRISKTMSRITGIFISVLPAIAAVTVLVLLLANSVARRLTRNILGPLNSIDFNAEDPNVYDELLPYVKKINQQKGEIDRQINMVKKRADTIEVITSGMREGLILLDISGFVLAINKSASDIFHKRGIEGKDIRHICRDLEFREGVRACLDGSHAEIVFKRGIKIYNVFFSPVCDGDEISGGVILFLDVSDKHKAEQQRREFSANVSHELKTPLTTISALAEMIENGMAKKGDIQSFGGKIYAQTKRLISIIDDIIKLSEFDEGKTTREHSDFDLYELTQSIVEVLRDKANEKRTTVSITGERFHVAANIQMIDERAPLQPD